VTDLPDTEDDGTTVSVETASDCAAPVSRVVIEGGGHSWPGGAQWADFLVGVTSQDVLGEELLWEVLEAL
jgi:poly(3-hydroxybutyrate) depolymerase